MINLSAWSDLPAMFQAMGQVMGDPTKVPPGKEEEEPKKPKEDDEEEEDGEEAAS
jgi:hypothetical protein